MRAVWFTIVLFEFFSFLVQFLVTSGDPANNAVH